MQSLFGFFYGTLSICIFHWVSKAQSSVGIRQYPQYQSDLAPVFGAFMAHSHPQSPDLAGRQSSPRWRWYLSEEAALLCSSSPTSMCATGRVAPSASSGILCLLIQHSPPRPWLEEADGLGMPLGSATQMSLYWARFPLPFCLPMCQNSNAHCPVLHHF